MLTFGLKVKHEYFYFTFSDESKINYFVILHCEKIRVSRQAAGRKWRGGRGGGI